jgi:hypothetical protein
MAMSIEELLFLASSAIILPVIAVFTVAFFSGGLKSTEEAKYVVTAEHETDYWDQTRGSASASDRPLPLPAIAGVPRGGE